jgi:excisionase family DNA binding protein
MDDWLTTAQAAELAGVSRMTLHRAAEAGEVTYAPTPLGRLFPRVEVERWAEARQEVPAA